MAAGYDQIYSRFDIQDVPVLIQARFYFIYSGISENLYKQNLQVVLDRLGPDKGSLSVDLIDRRLGQLQLEFEEKHGIYAANVDPEQMRESMQDGILKLQDNAQLVNPFAVLKLERAYKLYETGCLDKLIENWNRAYYSRHRCQEFNTDDRCFIKFIQYGDVEAFAAALPDMRKKIGWQKVLISVIECNRLEMLKMVLDAAEAAGFSLSIIEARDHIKKAFRSGNNTVDVVKYLTERYNVDLGQIDIVQDEYAGCSDNIRYYISQPGVSADILSSLLVCTIGYEDLFIEIFNMASSMAPVDQNIIDDSYSSACMEESYQIADFLYPMLSPDFDFRDLFRLLLEFACEDEDVKDFGRIVNLPNITREMILDKFESYQMPCVVDDLALNKTLDIIVQSGKITEEDIAKYRP